jgi:FkbM family methyltransferase
MIDRMNLEDYEKIDPKSQVQLDDVAVTFATPNQPTMWRVKTFFTKEPDTIEWLRGFDASTRLFDIGANVGMYAVPAARWRGAQVFAFEPEAANYALLNRNIHLNGVSDRAAAYCIAISDATGFDKLHLSLFEAGQSSHSLGESVDHNNQPRKSAFAQGCYFTSVDALVDDGMPVPTDIKIDVDGIEPKVIAGARRTLARPEVRSVLIEINSTLEEHWDIIDLLLSLGFDYSEEQVQGARRTEGAFKGVGNYVFRR